jgi:co-chaperonin GroES (HSP10)
MPAVAMLHEKDAKQVILDALGDIDAFEVWKNQVLCAVYERPEKTRSGIILADTTRDEDKFQGKVCLVVKMGPDAFVDDDNWTFACRAKVGDWVWFKTSDSFSITVNGKLCRVIDDNLIRGSLPEPDMVW